MKAFPHIAKVHYLDGNSVIKEEITSGGMELRDYFAAKALQCYWVDPDVTPDLKTAAAWSYDMADAMMEARKK